MSTNPKTEEAMTQKLDALAQPLARALGNIRFTLENWDEDDIAAGLFVVKKCVPLDPSDPDISQAERILWEALDKANAAFAAKNAPCLHINVEQDKGRWTLRVWHDDGDVLTREFATLEEAKAAGEAMNGFLSLQGRLGEYGWESYPGTVAEDFSIPF